MKYYAYISDTKVDMLYPQIPQPIFKKIASSLSIDIKLLGVELSVGAKSGQAEETRYSKVRIVSEYIEKHLDVGSIDAPSTYFKGKLPMHWGPVVSHQDLHLENWGAVYFGGFTKRTILGLGGSMSNIIGNEKGTSPISFYSTLPSILRVLNYEPQEIEHDYNARLALRAIELATKKLSGPTQNLEFPAKTLLQEPLEYYFDKLPQLYVVLGTPIYVAIDD